MFKLIYLLLTLLFLIIGTILGVLNSDTILLNLFIIKVSPPLSLVLASTFIIGLLLGSIVVFIRMGRLKWQLSRQLRDNQKLSDQIMQLENQQFTLEHASSTLIKSEK